LADPVTRATLPCNVSPFREIAGVMTENDTIAPKLPRFLSDS
jgi:hypothetical protein